MRVLRTAGLAALTLGMVVAACSAQKPAESSSWWSWGSPAKPKAPAKADPPPIDRANEMARLEKAYGRRAAVCDKLREVAYSMGDDRLVEEATRLEQIAWKVYQAGTDRLLREGAPVEQVKDTAVMDDTREMLLKSARKSREGRR